MKFLTLMVLTLALCFCVAYNDQQCEDRFGDCQYTSSTCQGGSYVSGLCGGPTNRRCCIPDFNDAQCIQLSGTCQSDSVTCQGGSYVSGKCGGPSNRRCCVQDSGSGSGSESGGCSDVTIVSRAEWGADDPVSISTMSTPVSLVFIHHTSGAACTSLASCASVARGVQNYHMNDPSRGYDDVGYNFLVGGDGKIYEGRGWDRQGAHTKYYNDRAVAISFMGNFQASSPTGPALLAAQNLVACGVSLGKLSSGYSLYGHRQAWGASTTCPGDTLFGIIQGWKNYKVGTAPN